MMEAGISAEPAQSSRSTPFGPGRLLANLWRRLVEITTVAAIFLRPSHARATEEQTESGAVETEGAIVTAALASDANISGSQIEAVPHPLPEQQEADANISGSQIEAVPHPLPEQQESNANISRPQIEAIPHSLAEQQEPKLQEPEQQEIERRRHLVRMYFNDFWDGASDKPAAFAARLDQAEHYLNERLAANGESWRVDAKTRFMLGLPPRVSSRASDKPAA
jgi:hypothetical protein